MHSPARCISSHLVTPRQLVTLVNPAIPGKGLRSIYQALSTPLDPFSRRERQLHVQRHFQSPLSVGVHVVQ
jgi:hypothetical protein